MKQEILKLNSNMYPIAVANWKSVMVDIIAGSAFPVDVAYTTDDKGQKVIEWFNVVRSFDDWAKLPIREGDEYVNSPRTTYRLPPIVVAAKFNKIIHKKVVFPTKSNIWNRDNWVCQYTGKKLTRDEISVDHIMPVSKGGQNTWENLVTASKEINVWKSDRTPKECGLQLLSKPTKPKNGMVMSFVRDEWKMFLPDSGSFDHT